MSKKYEYVYPIPRLYDLAPKFCERANYIPHTTPKNANRYEWHNTYIRQLIDIYNIIKQVINERYPHNKIKWDKEKNFHNLSRVIYHCSSKKLI